MKEREKQPVKKEVLLKVKEKQPVKKDDNKFSGDIDVHFPKKPRQPKKK